MGLRKVRAGHSAPIPRGQRRRREIAVVAERVFLKHGFSDTTMQMVASEAGASKETLYRHFGSKEDLFGEAVASRISALRTHLDAGFESGEAIGVVLRATGINLLQSMSHPDVLALLRIVVVEAPRNPELGEVLYAIGPERTNNRLSEYLAKMNLSGTIKVEDPSEAATIFIGAVLAGAPLMHLIKPAQDRIGLTQTTNRVEAVVKMFLKSFS